MGLFDRIIRMGGIHTRPLIQTGITRQAERGPKASSTMAEPQAITSFTPAPRPAWLLAVSVIGVSPIFLFNTHAVNKPSMD